MALNYIYIGSTTTPSFFFSNEQITSLNANISIDAVGNELAIDTLEFEVMYEDTDNSLRSLGYGTPIFYYDSQHFVGKFYFKNISRIGTNHYKIYSVSVIGLMEFEKHYGGYYQNKNLRDAVTETFISNGLKTNVFTDYILLSPGATSVALADNYFGANSYVSGSNTNIYVWFNVNAFPSTNEALYYVYARDDNAGMSYYYACGVIITSGGYCDVYCSYGSSEVRRAHIAINVGDDVEVMIRPDVGSVIYRINNGTAYTVTFTAITNFDIVLPLYATRGIAHYRKYSDSQTSITELTAITGSYKVHCLQFFHVVSGSVVPCMELQGMKNYFSNTSFMRDIVSGKSYYNNSYYSSGGDTISIEKSFADVITSDEVNSELANIANNIQWDGGVENLTFTGWIPSGTKREVLHQILFALNLNLYKDGNGNLIIGKLPDEIDETITEDEIYNEGSVENVKQPKRIELTEHYYGSPSASQQVFDNSSGTTPSGTYIVDLNNAPVYGNVTGSSGMTVISNNANAAIVSGKGKLYAQAYDHSKRVITADISTRPDGDTVSVSNATLVTYLNSNAVMNKLKAYYANNAYIIKNAIIGNGRKAGRKFTLSSPFHETDNAYLMSARITASAVTKYDCEFVAGYTPVQAGNTYNHFVVLSGSGTWSVPSGVESIFVVLVGGGQGGTSGLAGEDGKRMELFSNLGVAKGGAYGANGSGGKVYTRTIANPSSSYSYACGTGGAGGATCTSTETGNVGSLGTATTFGSYSSASGASIADGYTNILSGDVFARSMPTWNSESGAGGDGGYTTVGQNKSFANTVQHKPGEAYNFLTGETFSGGKSGDMRAWGSINGGGGADTRTIAQIGGSGGGAALNMKGKAARKGNPATTDVTKLNELLVGGDGADATYVPPKATDYNSKYYGYGGMGGAGGGGGGNGGGYENTWSGESPFIVGYGPGGGGYGGRGGAGGDGCVVVFY